MVQETAIQQKPRIWDTGRAVSEKKSRLAPICSKCEHKEAEQAFLPEDSAPSYRRPHAKTHICLFLASGEPIIVLSHRKFSWGDLLFKNLADSRLFLRMSRR
jgi:hypothetical protein